MKKKHQKTYEAIHNRPASATIPWRKIEALFVHLGAEIIEGGGSRISVVLNEEVAVFHRPHPQKEAVKGAVVAVREFLRLAGVEQC